jgi:hypothetical protein
MTKKKIAVFTAFDRLNEKNASHKEIFGLKIFQGTFLNRISGRIFNASEGI